MTTSAQVVAAYFAGVTAGDAIAVADLFADDAILHNAAGTLKGNDAIRRMYEQGLAGAKMTPSPGRLVIDGDTVAVEIDLEVDGAAVRLGDFFTIRSGRIQQLSIYSLTPNGGRLLEKVGVDPQNHNPGDS
ncbi:MAG: nuclear transport factor 2 family protein [Mycetocola sp.]